MSWLTPKMTCDSVTGQHTPEVKQRVQQRRGISSKATRAQPFTQFKISRGVAVLVRGRLDGGRVVAALEQALAQARAALEGEPAEQAEQAEPGQGE